MKNQQEEWNDKWQYSNKIWCEIQKLYRLQTGKALQRIELKDYAMAVFPLLLLWSFVATFGLARLRSRREAAE
ncbi:hypothetical protein ACI7RC_22225 [Brevibacillus sp. B_LB10_24]|uniref:hypothetical protein n=1 Tax=Brevibacillus sp. B_LB10_24 TaxID=3380645 RepID=UPI0038B73038